LRLGQHQACLAGHVGKRAVAVVAEQHILVVIGEEQVIQAVVVVIADGDAGDPAGTGEAGFRSDILERPIAIVLVKPVAGAVGSVAEARATKNQDVEPAIVIVVKEGDAATDGFENVALGVDTPVNAGSVQAGLLAISVNFASKGRPERRPRCWGRTLRVAMPCAKIDGTAAVGTSAWRAALRVMGLVILRE
jgi:hypothetical protein